MTEIDSFWTYSKSPRMNYKYFAFFSMKEFFNAVIDSFYYFSTSTLSYSISDSKTDAASDWLSA